VALSQVRHFDAFSADRERPFHLGVVIPLRPASTARSWPTVVARLRSTVGSLLRQTARESTAVIVGQENPDRLGASPRLSMITTTAPPPAAIADRRARRADKEAKLRLGMQHLASLHRITHWFHLDADDLIHERFVATLAAMATFDVAVVRKGYLHFPTLGRYRATDRIDRICGSTVITSDRWWAVPHDPALRHYSGLNHRRMYERAALRGVTVRDYPGPGMAYVLGHGDHLYDTLGRRARVWIESRLLSRACDAEFRSAFGPDEPPDAPS